MSTLQLSLALLANERSRPIIDGVVRADGIDFVISRGLAGGELFWRQLHSQDFDVAELSLSDMLMLVSRGDRTWLMLPVFMTRRFFHTNVLVRSDAGIEKPTDLNGKRIGVQEYVQTANVWARGILRDEFDLRYDEVRWHQERPEALSHSHHFGAGKPAKHFEYLPTDKTVGGMLVTGELDAVFTYSGKPTTLDRSSIDLRKHPAVRPLFQDAKAEGLRYYRKAGIFPMNHGPVIRRSIVERHPWVVLNLYDAFTRAKQHVASQVLACADVHAGLGMISADAHRALRQDPFPYGVKANREALETLFRYSFEQGLSARQVRLEEVFAPATLDF